MKRTLTLIAFVAVCCAMAVSCKNAKNAAPTPEEIQAQKVSLADSVLAEIDAIVDEYINASEHSFRFTDFGISETEKMVKPDYLLDLSFAGTLVSKSQKANALAFYFADLPVREIYDLQVKEAKEVIAKLAVEINHPIDEGSIFDFNKPASEKIKSYYELCKERGELASFWQFQNALIIETAYIIAQNPELFFSKITEEQWQSFIKRANEKNKAIGELAKYDEEMAAILEIFNQTKAIASKEEKVMLDSSFELTKQFTIANKDRYIAKRNALLQ